MFGRRATFGKDNVNLAQLQEMMRNAPPDDDGVKRVFPKEIWDDPKIGAMLRECGFTPDDPRNRVRTAEDYGAMFTASSKRLEERVATFNHEMAARYGYCNAAPFFVIDRPIWDGEHGAFLYASMDLFAFDDWNVMMLAADAQTKDACDIAAHPGSVPAVNEGMTNYVVEWKARFQSALEAYGLTAVPGSQGEGGITREQFEVEKDTLRQDIVDRVAWMKPRIVAELLRVQG